MQLGYALSCEEHRPTDLVRFARRAEQAGFEFAMISDHYHPWTDRQGNSPFAWSVLEIWPNAGITGEASQELPVPAHFEQLAQMVTEDMAVKEVTCGPDAAQHVAAIRTYLDAGYDHVYVHQVGPDQDGMIEFYASEVLPRLRESAGKVKASEASSVGHS